jgi:hypothetical protein
LCIACSDHPGCHSVDAGIEVVQPDIHSFQVACASSG